MSSRRLTGTPIGRNRTSAVDQFDITDSSIWKKTVRLTGNITRDTFESDIYALLREVANIAHFAVHIFDAAQVKEHRLSLVGGPVSYHWAQYATRRAEAYSRQKNQAFDHNLEQIARGLLEPEGIFRYRPDNASQPEIAAVYKQGNILEKVYELRVTQGRIYQLNLYRAIRSGPFSDDEIRGLEGLLPLIMSLVLLHFQICGADEWQKHNGKHVISFLKNNGVDYFSPLTGQETEVCDLIIYGQTTDGIAAEMDISVSSVKTYRNRAYKKLNITSKSELFALIINSQIYTAHA